MTGQDLIGTDTRPEARKRFWLFLLTLAAGLDRILRMDSEPHELDFTNPRRYGGQLPILSDAELDDALTLSDWIAPSSEIDEADWCGEEKHGRWKV
jgi:hypothetical protein